MPFPTEPFSTYTHLAGALVCSLAAPALLRRASTPLRRRALGVFAASAITLLLASSLYHAMPDQTLSRTVTQRLDHAAIFLLIAGSFTPIHVILFRGLARWGVLALIWLAALSGVVVKSIFFTSVPEQAGIAAYLILGWSGGVSILVILIRHGPRVVSPLLLGGLAYTAGALCEFTRLPIILPGVIGSHDVFHLAVLLGLGSMWLFMHRIAGGPEPLPRGLGGRTRTDRASDRPPHGPARVSDLARASPTSARTGSSDTPVPAQSAAIEPKPDPSYSTS